RARLVDYRGAPQRAAQLMIEIATAVHYLHRDPVRPDREPILHRDLKPENILFGAGGQPRISDFGIAKLATGNIWKHDTHPVGCACYVAPEQVYPTRKRELTAAADVYALGAILYELFTGRPPFDGTDAEILYQLKRDEPVPPSQLAPELDRFLEAVVLNALEKDPTRRYRSAAAFAQDLQRALEKKAPEERPVVAPSARLRTWLRKHPLSAWAGVWLASLLVVIAVSARSTLSARVSELDREQQINASVAGMQAVAVNLQLRAYKHRIAELAQDPEVIALLEAASASSPSEVLLTRLAPFDTMFVMWPSGVQRVRTSPKSAEYMQRNFAFRDYFEGARQLGQEECARADSASAAQPRKAHVARAYTSESDGHFEFAISAPLCRHQRWLGILGGTIATDKVLGAVQLLDDHHGRITAVLGPRDRERGAPLPLPSDLTFIVHPGLMHGQALALHRPDPATLRAALGLSLSVETQEIPSQLRYSAPLRIDDYRDPVPGFDGAWAAVFAAADESGYLVAVQSRRVLTPLAQALLAKLVPSAGVPFGVALLTLVVLGLARRRTEQSLTELSAPE
ncbi:MAG: protein kinase, partial [Polyangiaceae bacterium]